ncbi:hypothetical protein AMJ57_02025 [Parcubacteria bacterium SG8_24]|nr:MAG: hypothetical protein AMJ57_02025 [Parcubacteria bacterium SG8_24]
MYNILIIGPQGSGKGTQSRKISERLAIPAISSGNLLRAEVERGTGLGGRISSYIEKGDRVPSDVVDQVIAARLAEDDTVRGVILDGYPRTVDQAERLQVIMGDLGRQITHVVYLDVPDSEVVKRLAGRRVCSNSHCAVNYHAEYNPPKGKPHVCDVCGGQLVQRIDDHPEAIRHRLELFHRDTEPLVSYYRRQDILHEIDGAGSIDEVGVAVSKALGIP